MEPGFLLASGLAIIGAVLWVVCAIYCYRIAPTFGRRAGLWAVLGVILGPIALMILYVLPKHQPLPGHGRGSHKDAQAALYEKPRKD